MTSPDRFHVRPVAKEDIPALAVFIEPFVADGKLLPRTTEELDDLLPSGFIATDADGQVVGFAALEVYSKKMAEIRSLAVAKHCQRSGVGRALVLRCVELARQRNVLEVMAITSADGFFLSCGFDFTLPGEKKALFIQP